MSISNQASGIRYCSSCENNLPCENFSIRKNGKYVSYCKVCNAEKTANYRANNRERYLESKRQARRKWKEQKSVEAIKFNWDNLTIDQKEETGCGIYCITIGDYFYIGSCVSFKQRIHEHTRRLGSNRHVNKKMQNVFNKYQLFEVELIEKCTPAQLSEIEQKYIDQWFNHPKCMNLNPTAGTMFGFKHSEETKQKIRQIRTGTKATEATRAKLKVVQSGRLHTEESKKKMSELAKNRKHSIATKIKLSKRKKRYTDDQIQQIINRVSNGESQTSVAHSFGCSQSAIHAIVNKKRLYQMEGS